MRPRKTLLMPQGLEISGDSGVEPEACPHTSADIRRYDVRTGLREPCHADRHRTGKTLRLNGWVYVRPLLPQYAHGN